MYKGLYPKLVERFRANSLDILQYCTGKEFDTDLTCDRSGHPSQKGYDMLQKMHCVYKDEMIVQSFPVYDYHKIEDRHLFIFTDISKSYIRVYGITIRLLIDLAKIGVLNIYVYINQTHGLVVICLKRFMHDI